MKALAVTVLLVALLASGIGLPSPAPGYDAGSDVTVPSQVLWLVQIRL
jgi:hypothetical protein